MLRTAGYFIDYRSTFESGISFREATLPLAIQLRLTPCKTETALRLSLLSLCQRGQIHHRISTASGV